jgi:leucyl/phenylalanyl-tRNA---protein transferase
MPIFELNNEIVFPSPEYAEKDGLLAIGGDLSPQRLLFGFSLGIFPWYSAEDPILWWSPDPRFVIFPEKAKISKSTKKDASKFNLKINTNFDKVIDQCATAKRQEQDGTWITEEMKTVYIKLHKLGLAMSFEAYYDNILVGGLYGVRCGQIFIGESMFHTKSNASKSAFMYLIDFCVKNKIKLIDCQFHTNHLKSLGGEYISREKYKKHLEEYFDYK